MATPPKDKKFLLEESKVFCMLPWSHLVIRKDQRVRTCCVMEHEGEIGNLTHQRLEEIWNSPKQRKFRLDMLEGKRIPECRRCYEIEESGGRSYRHDRNEALGKHIAQTEDTSENGTLPFRLQTLELSISNVCNFKCRMCYPEDSSKWHEDANKMGRDFWGKWTPEQPKVLRLDNFSDFIEQINPALPYLEMIEFKGGEPLMTREHFQILNHLIENNHTHIELHYNTNFSTLKYQGFDFTQAWKKFDKVVIAASLDALGDQGKYIRWGTNWDEISANREILRTNSPNVQFIINATAQVSNVFSLPSFHTEAQNRGWIEPDEFYIHLLHDPENQRTQILPPSLKEEIKKIYPKYIDSLSDGMSKTCFQTVLEYTLQEDKSHLIPAFLRDMRSLDQIRGEDFFQVFPELKGMEEYEK